MEDKLRVFLSYSYKDRHTASQIKNQLESNGLLVFMAHDDIKPSLEWQTVIVEELKKCDIFIPLFSKNFRASKWADQEIGIAFGYYKIIIPASLDEISPYGFVGKYQGLKCKDIPSSCDQIIETILSKPIADKLKQTLVNHFINSENFYEAKDRAKRLTSIGSLTKEQVNDIVFGYLDNNQIRGSFEGARFVRALVKDNEDRVNPALLSLYKKLEENEKYPFENDDGLLGAYIQAIRKRRPNLTFEAIKQLIQAEKDRGLSTYAAIFKVIDNLGMRNVDLFRLVSQGPPVKLPDEMNKALRSTSRRLFLAMKREGNEFYVAGTGLVAGKEVEVYLDRVANNDLLDIFTAKSDGTWAGLVEIPAETSKGIHYFWAKDVTTGVVEKAEINIQ